MELKRGMVNWKYNILGAGLVVLLGWFGGMFEYGAFIGIFISGIIVGYLVNNGYKNGAKNGIITGIIGGDFSTTLIFNGDSHISFSLFEEGLSMATLLNVILFVQLSE